MDLHFSFKGRISRAQFWFGLIVLLIVSVIIGFVIAVSSTTLGLEHYFKNTILVNVVFMLLLAYPMSALMVKRLHDRDRPTWLVAVFWMPTILSILGNILGITFKKADIGGKMFDIPTSTGWFVIGLMFVIGIWSLVELGGLKGTPDKNQHGPVPLNQ